MDTHEIIQPLNDNRIWVKVVGVFSIVYGVLTCLSIVGLIIGWLPIWLGLALVQVSSNLEKYETSNDIVAAIIGFEKLAMYFKILGIIIVIFVGTLVVSLVLAIVFGFLGWGTFTMTMTE